MLRLRLRDLLLLVTLAACPNKAAGPAPAAPVAPAQPSKSFPPFLAALKDVPSWATSFSTTLDAELEDALEVLGKVESYPQLAQSPFWQDRVKAEGARLCVGVEALPTLPQPVPPEWAAPIAQLTAAAKGMCDLRAPFSSAGTRGPGAVPELKRQLQALQGSVQDTDAEVGKLQGAPEQAPR